MKNAYIVIKVTLKDDADVLEVANDCDYSIEHDSVVDTELIEVQVGYTYKIKPSPKE